MSSRRRSPRRNGDGSLVPEDLRIGGAPRRCATILLRSHATVKTLSRREIVLQWPHGDLAVAVADDAFDGGDRAGDGGVVGDLAHQRRAADVAAVGDRFGAVG